MRIIIARKIGCITLHCAISKIRLAIHESYLQRVCKALGHMALPISVTSRSVYGVPRTRTAPDAGPHINRPQPSTNIEASSRRYGSTEVVY